MIATPEIIQTEPVQTAMIPLSVERAGIEPAFGAAIDELFQTLAAQGLAPSGPVYAHHLRMSPEVFEFELGVPVARAVTPSGRVRPGELPGTRAARTVYLGPYERLPEAWGAFDAWFREQGLAPAGNLWEVYAEGPGSVIDPARYRTELYRPVRP